MSRQRQFSLVAFLLAFLLVTSHYLDPYGERPFLILLFLELVALASLFWLFRPNWRFFRQPARRVFFLPLAFLAAFSLFYSLFPPSFLGQLLFFSLAGGMFYLTIAVGNIFLVSAEYKLVPLYRAAFSLSLLAILVSLYLLNNFLLSYRLTFWQNGLLVFAASLPFFDYYFWAASLEEKRLSVREFFPFSLAAALILAELALALSFWPLTTSLLTLYLVSFSYLLLGIFQAAIRRRLFKNTLRGYLGVAAGVLAALLFLSFL